MKRIFLAAVISGAICDLRAEDKAPVPAVAVMDIKTTALGPDEAQATADFMRTALGNNGKGRYKVIDRKSIGTILGDLKMDVAMGKDVDVAVRVGKILGANMMVVGSITNLDKIYFLNIQVVNVETAEIMAAASEEGKNFKKLKKAAGKAGKALAQQIINRLEPAK
ncbi:MAG: hypothetical protein HY547_09770 [Elusimicrobia bacterium]|nr:hypothetical protein [Elusimicrobiota bacterium]